MTAYALLVVPSASADRVAGIPSIASNLGGAWTTLANSFLYQSATDRVFAWRLGNGLSRTYAHDTDYRLTALSGSSVHSLTYGWNATDTLCSITDNVYPALNTGFAYDTVDLLTGVSKAGDNQGFGFADLINRTSQARQGVGYTYVSDSASNRLLSVSGGAIRSFGYDNAGNLTTEVLNGVPLTYGYDAFDRLTAVTVSGSQVGATNTMPSTSEYRRPPRAAPKLSSRGRVVNCCTKAAQHPPLTSG